MSDQVLFNTPKHNNIYVYSTLGGAIAGAAIAYFAGAATLASLGVAIAVFIASAVVGALVGYGIAQVCKKVSEKEERGSNVDSELLSTFVERSNQQQL
ncbi:hypothetical protein [Wolbachia endosymbiont (group B) of Limnophora tigrina]|uniref:hypothetical protein n=1 Tax=Wolbachia endosymbiont (group B) of Limnophora tigrina TaxID=3139317 RepID=UPI0035B5350A